MALKDKFVNALSTRTGLPADKAKMALEQTLELIKTKLHVRTAAALDALMASNNGIDHIHFGGAIQKAADILVDVVKEPVPVTKTQPDPPAEVQQAPVPMVSSQEVQQAPVPMVSSQEARQASSPISLNFVAKVKALWAKVRSLFKGAK
jgi:hypothetical protein